MWGAASERIAVSRGPQVKRSRAALAVGASATDQTESMKTSGAVAKRSSRRLSNEKLELGLGYDPVVGDDPKQAKVEVRER